MIRAVIDTNVLVSALISPSGNEDLLLLSVKQGLVRPCFSHAVLKEYSEVLARPRFAFSPAEITALIDLLRRQGDLLHPAPLSGISPDPKDDEFIACALTTQADFVVTGNKKDFPKNQLGATQVVSAGELLNLITLEL
ncbi:MAG: putative toxin-antitoxin system toxin component, PIN family [Candidatus Sulfotelmatobacter sp.]|jgi:putative PIN family toxin of toxin-antitoxin system